MRTTNDFHLNCERCEVKTEGGQLVLEGRLRLQVPAPPQDEWLPAQVEQAVEAAGQELKRWIFRELLEKLDAELVLSRRGGKDGQGIVGHGRRGMTFLSVFGRVSVARRRVRHVADGTTEPPSATAWQTPQQVTITQGLVDATCDAMLQESSRKALRHLEERAGEAELLGRVSVLDVVHAEGGRLREALRQRAEAVFQADAKAARCLLPRIAEPSSAEPAASPEPEEAWECLAGFPGAAAVESVPREQPRRVDAATVMVQADEVSVHAQASSDAKEIRVYNAVVSTAERTWYFSEANAQALILVVGAWLATLGVHRGQRRLLFVNDGARWIRDWFEGLQVKSKQMVLCWYHLARRCLQNLGSAGGKRRAEEIGKDLLGHLWEGRLDEALAVLARHRPTLAWRPAVDQLVEYLQKRRPYLPQYRVRQEGGLWIASNRVEKLNDWTVSQRCKHRGMAWTREGVVALAVLESARRNGELPVWRRQRTLPPWREINTTSQAA